MPINFNDAADQKPGTMPDGAYWVRARVRAGNAGPDGQLTLAKNLYSLMLALELTIIDNDEWRGKKLLDWITCGLEEYDHSDPDMPPPLVADKLEGLQASVRMGRSRIKGILNSAFNLQPNDDSEEAQAKRNVDSYKDFNNLTFMVQVITRPAEGKFRERNIVDFIIEPDDPVYKPRGSNSKAMTAPAPKPKPGVTSGGGVSDLDDSIPFAPNFL